MLATGKAQWTTVCRVVALLALCVPGETSVVVRESSDDAFSSLVHPDVHQHSAVRTSAKDPASIEGGWDANFGVTVDGSSNVLSWWDTTGKGYDVAPMYNTGAPMYSSTGINGHPAVHFENNEHLVSTQTHPSACTPDTSYTWIAVVKMEGTGWENIFSTQDACAQHLNDYSYPYNPWSMANDGVHGWWRNGNWHIKRPICSSDTMCVYAHRYNSATSEYTIRTLQEDSAEYSSHVRQMTPTCASQAQGCVLFGRGMQNTHHGYRGWIGESLAYTFPLSDTDLTDLMAQLKAKWMPGAPPPSAPTWATTASPASATGDPHIINMYGERFDIYQPGDHVLLQVPRSADQDTTKLRVVARAERLGAACGEIYFLALNLTGRWVDDSLAADHDEIGHGAVGSCLHFDAESPREQPSAQWMYFGGVGLKVVGGHTPTGTKYLNVYVKHLSAAGPAVGGLLGADDHADVSIQPVSCAGRISLKLGSGVSAAAPVAAASIE